VITSSPKRSIGWVDKGLAVQQIAWAGLSSVVQGEFEPFWPHLCSGKAISGSSHQSVCILPGSLQPSVQSRMRNVLEAAIGVSEGV
jgi:hypothetical protein